MGGLEDVTANAMTGPAYVLMGWVLVVLVFYVSAIRPSREGGSLRWSKGRAALHGTLFAAGLACLVGIPTFARPGPQPLLSGVITVVVSALIGVGAASLVRKNIKKRGADK